MKTHSRGKKSAFNRLSVLLRQGKIKTLRCIIKRRGRYPVKMSLKRMWSAKIRISSKEDFNRVVVSVFNHQHSDNFMSVLLVLPVLLLVYFLS